MAKTNRWCFTVNANAQDFYDDLDELYEAEEDHIRYICGQLETASTGQLHFQGYLQLFKSQRITWVKSHINRGAHFEKQHGTNAQARDYCNKEESRAAPFIECGTFVGKSGQRTDLANFRDAIKEGKRKEELLDTYVKELARYPKFYDLVRSINRPKRTTDLKVRLNYGETGTGKTRYAYDNYPDLFDVPVTQGSLWFDGYDMHKNVLLDDFAGAASKISLTYTLRMLDRYPIQLPVKGSHCWWMPDLIIITTNIHPQNWYNWENRDEQYHALLRRIHEVYYYTKDKEPLLLTGENYDYFKSNDMEGVEYPQVDISMADSEDESSEEEMFVDGPWLKIGINPSKKNKV